jgi:4-nitrophenyl phosphatase
MTILFTSLRAVILDMDGVLWRSNQVLPGVTEFFAFVQQHQIAFALATNNSTKSAESYVERLNQIGIPAGPEQVITSAAATADYVSRRYPPETPLYIIGEAGIHQTLAERGYHEDPEQARVVIVGLDTTFSYDKLKIATLRIRAGADFIGTNSDRTFPIPGGLVPGNGSLLAAVQAATDVEPVVIGKPEKIMFEVALQRMGTTPAQTLMIGDRLETDILGARRAGLPSALVLTGVTPGDQARVDDIQADGVFDSLLALYHAWRSALVVP